MRARIMPGWPVRLLVLGGLLLGSVTAPASLLAQQASRSLTAQEAASHVLNRLAFGSRPGQANDVAKAGWQRWVELQLDPEKIDDSALDKLLADRCPSVFQTLSELQEQSKDNKRRARIKDELREAVLLRAVYGKRQFQEIMIEFWRNHLNVDVNKVPFLATRYEEDVLRPNAFGKFEDLLLASAKHPAMLVYLDNHVSHKRGLNENYARELMELHTLGVDNGYTQQDVIALARVLTGWTCGWKDGAGGRRYKYHFDAQMHDTNPALVVGLSLDGSGGAADGEKALRHLANHEGTARFIVTKLCRYLVSDMPSSELIDRVAGVFRQTGGDLRQVYRAIILGPEFMDARNLRTKFKTPFEYTVSALRATAAEVDSCEQLFRELKVMGQPVYECEEPTGYSDARESWGDPGIMVFRWNFAIALVTDKIKGVKIGPRFADEVLNAPAAARSKKVMELVLPGVTDARTQYLASQTNDPRAMVAWALGSPSFQQQ